MSKLQSYLGATMNKYLHVGLNIKSAPAKQLKNLEKLFSEVGDWLRYAPNCWIVYTDKTPAALRERLRKLLADEDEFLVFEVKWENFAGFASDLVKKWVEKKRSAN